MKALNILPLNIFAVSFFGGSVQSLSHVWLFATPWTAVHQASLSITNPQSLLKLISIEWVMPSNHLILCCPLLLPPSIWVMRNNGKKTSGDHDTDLCNHGQGVWVLLYWFSDAIQPSHSLSSPSPPALNLSQHQGLFKWVSSSLSGLLRFACLIYSHLVPVIVFWT